MSPPGHIVTDGADRESSYERTRVTVVRGWDDDVCPVTTLS